MLTLDEDSRPVDGVATAGQIDACSGRVAGPTVTIPANAHLLLNSLELTAARLQTSAKVAVRVPAFRVLLTLLVERLPFDEVFYKTTYPDLAEASDKEVIPDLRQHFIQNGFFEGRFGSPPDVDEKYYRDTYPDVDDAIKRSVISSALEHYIGGGAAEGRFANAEEEAAWKKWLVRIGDK
jgi:hypothetical protein